MANPTGLPLQNHVYRIAIGEGYTEQEFWIVAPAFGLAAAFALRYWHNHGGSTLATVQSSTKLASTPTDRVGFRRTGAALGSLEPAYGPMLLKYRRGA